jgi:hypothetical protein
MPSKKKHVDPHQNGVSSCARQAKPILDDLEHWLQRKLPKLSCKTPLANAIRYALTRMKRLSSTVSIDWHGSPTSSAASQIIRSTGLVSLCHKVIRGERALKERKHIHLNSVWHAHHRRTVSKCLYEGINMRWEVPLIRRKEPLSVLVIRR